MSVGDIFIWITPDLLEDSFFRSYALTCTEDWNTPPVIKHIVMMLSPRECLSVSLIQRQRDVNDGWFTTAGLDAADNQDVADCVRVVIGMRTRPTKWILNQCLICAMRCRHPRNRRTAVYAREAVPSMRMTVWCASCKLHNNDWQRIDTRYICVTAIKQECYWFISYENDIFLLKKLALILADDWSYAAYFDVEQSFASLTIWHLFPQQ